MPEVDLAQATLQCRSTREAVAFASQALPVTISIGVSAHRPADTPSASGKTRADAALYAANAPARRPPGPARIRLLHELRLQAHLADPADLAVDVVVAIDEADVAHLAPTFTTSDEPLS